LEFPLLDKSNYLKGLLIIARKDNKLAQSEKDILKSTAERLGFSSDFYEETIKNLLINKHIIDEPIKFSNKKIAESFVLDGLKLAYSDKEIDGAEINWLKITAAENSLDEDWFSKHLLMIKEESDQSLKSDLTLFSII